MPGDVGPQPGGLPAGSRLYVLLSGLALENQHLHPVRSFCIFNIFCSHLLAATGCWFASEVLIVCVCPHTCVHGLVTIDIFKI